MIRSFEAKLVLRATLRLTFVLACVFCLACPASAATGRDNNLGIYLLLLGPDSVASGYYVSQSHPNADDENPGSLDLPLKSIGAALALAQPGDTITVGDGVYRESLAFPRDGTQAAPIRLVAQSQGKAVVNGSDVVQDWAPAYDKIWVRYNWGIKSQQVFCDGVPLQQIGISSPFHTVAYAGNVFLPPQGTGLADMIPGSFWYDTASGDLYVWLADGSSPESHLMEASVRNYVIMPRTRSHIQLDGMAFSHSNLSALGIYGSMANAWGQSWKITNCTFSYGDFGGLTVVGDDHILANNHFISNGNLGLSINGSDELHGWSPYDGRPVQNIVLSGNEASYNNYRLFDSGWQAGGIKAANSCNGLSILDQIGIGNKGPAIWFDVLCRDINVNRAYLRSNEIGVAFEISDDADISSNVLVSNTYGVVVSSSSDSNVFFNTLQNNVNGVILIDMNRDEHPTTAGNTLRNNYFYNSQGVDFGMFVTNFFALGNTSDYNAYARADQPLYNIWTDAGGGQHGTSSLSTFQVQTAQDGNSILTATEAAANQDGTLTASGDLVDQGTEEGVPADAKDYYGKPRIAGFAPDIGAVEK